VKQQVREHVKYRIPEGKHDRILLDDMDQSTQVDGLDFRVALAIMPASDESAPWTAPSGAGRREAACARVSIPHPIWLRVSLAISGRGSRYVCSRPCAISVTRRS
jgi:hypothetical protein